MGISPWFALIEGFQLWDLQVKWCLCATLRRWSIYCWCFFCCCRPYCDWIEKFSSFDQQMLWDFWFAQEISGVEPEKVWQWSTVVNTIWAKRIPGTWSWTLWFQGHFRIWHLSTQISSMCFPCQAAGTPGFEATLWSELGAGDRSLGFMGIQRYDMNRLNRLCKGHGLLFCENLRWFLWHWQGWVWKQSTLDGKIPNQAFLCCFVYWWWIWFWYDMIPVVQQKLNNCWSPFHRTHGLLAALWWQGAC